MPTDQHEAAIENLPACMLPQSADAGGMMELGKETCRTPAL